MVELRIPYNAGVQIERELLKATEERVTLTLVGGAKLFDSYLLLISSLLPVPSEAYLQSGRGTSWSASFNAEAIDVAQKARLGIVILHSHGQSPEPKLSPIDLENGTRLVGAFRTALPNFAHGTAVFGKSGSVGGLAWLPGEASPLGITHARWISDPIRKIPDPQSKGQTPAMYSRQKVLLGEEGQRRLASSRVGVIGLGGGGSIVAQQLALLGVGHIVLVDQDIVKEVNRNRMAGVRPADVKAKMKKIDAIKRMILDSNPTIEVASVPDFFPSDESIRQLKECDCIVGCVDTLATRKELQTFAWRYLVPYVDIGVIIQPEEVSVGPKRAKSVSGQIYDLIPGSACLWCAQFLTERGLADESRGRGPTYIKGYRQKAQIVSFNGTLASEAVTEVLHLLTGFSARKRVPNALQFDGLDGTVHPVVLTRKDECKVCSTELGRGDPTW